MRHPKAFFGIKTPPWSWEIGRGILFSVGVARLTLELHDGKAQHLPEVAKVGRTNAETEFQRGYADQKIGKRNSYSSCLIFAVELAGAKRKRHGHRMDGHGGEKFCDEILPIGSSLGSVGTSRTVR